MKVIFFHMNQLGDLIFSLPVLGAVRKAFPSAYLASVVRRPHKDLIESLNILDKTIVRPRKGILNKMGIIRGLRNEKYDVGIFFSESPETLLMGYLGAIKKRIGFRNASLSFLVTDKVTRTGVPSLKNNKLLAEVFGVNGAGSDYTGFLNVPESYMKSAIEWMKSENISKDKILLMSPGASNRRKSKCWSENSWANLIDTASEKGLLPVITGASGEEEGLKRINGLSKSKCRIFIPKESIFETAALMKNSKVIVSIDSGAMHLAAALGLKTVSLFASTDPAQIGPMPANAHIIIRKEKIDDIAVHDVWQAVALNYA